MKQQSYIGTVLELDAARYAHAISYWENTLFPQISALAEQYNRLGIGTFDQEAFHSLRTQGTAPVRSRSRAATLNNAGVLQAPALSEIILTQVDRYLNPLEQHLQKLQQLKDKPRTYLTGALVLEWEDCRIVNGAPVLDKEKLKARYTISIESEQESELYVHLLALQKVWEELRRFLVKNGYPTDRMPLIGANGFFHEDNECHMVINTHTVKNAL